MRAADPNARKQEPLEIVATPVNCQERDRQVRALYPGQTVTVNTPGRHRSHYFFRKYVDPVPGIPAPLR